MMIGEPNRHTNPTVHVPPWAFPDDDTTAYDAYSFPSTISGISVNTNNQNNADELLFPPLDALTSLHQFLPSNEPDYDSDGSGGLGFETDFYQGLYASDQFRMYEFKIKKCTRARSHDWTDCPFAHPGEKARRRDPRKFQYLGTACPDFRKGACKKGDTCEYAHGVFECWLHPSRYRTQPCKDGSGCRRRVCFFAHSADQLRVLSPGGSGHQLVESYDGSPHRLAVGSSCSSPVSDSLSEMVRRLQLNKVKSMPTSWGVQVGSPRFGMVRPVFSSLPNTPTGRIGGFDQFEMSGSGSGSEEEFVMQRVESGRGLRARMFEKLSRENPLDRVDPAPQASSGPDVGWISELVK